MGPELKTQAWSMLTLPPVLSITTITQGINYPLLSQLRVSHRDFLARTVDFLAAFSIASDVVDTNQMTQKQIADHAKDISNRQ